MKIEKMKLENLDIYRSIYQDVFKRDPWFIDEADHLVKAYIMKYFSLNNFLGYEILVDSQVLGFILGTKKPWIEGYEYYIDQFCLRHQYQGQGYGSQALKLLEDLAHQEELTCISLTTDRQTRSYDFYRKNDFVSLGEYAILAKEI